MLGFSRSVRGNGTTPHGQCIHGVSADGDCMTTKTQRDARTREIGWLAGMVGGLLLIGLGLELLAHQTFGQTDMATFLLAVYLAVWFSVLGIVGFVILAITWLISWWRLPSNRIADPEGHGCSQPSAIAVAQSGCMGRQ